jgi:hypothetical protein
MFSQKDRDYILSNGLHPEAVFQQLDRFRSGFPFPHIVKPADISDGIVPLDSSIIHQYAFKFEEAMKEKDILLFIPASGAATRMFKDIFEYLLPVNKAETLEITKFVEHIRSFAFFKDLQEVLKCKSIDIEHLLAEKDYKTLFRFLLYDEGLKYGNLPKGLLKFHCYQTSCRTPLEEHLVESVNYCHSEGGVVRIHMTISPEHEMDFINFYENCKSHYEERFSVKYDMTFSFQNTATDSIAVDENNQPFRDLEGNLVFRPSGHGALLENLNRINADIIFIKNIDNVAPDRTKQDNILYKKVLAGLLLSYQKKIFRYLHQIEDNPGMCSADLNEVVDFIEKSLSYSLPSQIKNAPNDLLLQALRNILNRPVRICGMVRNEGEPGGGPFWVRNCDGSVSLQIIEGSQVNHADPDQNRIFRAAGYFNPVDLVCGVRNFKGEKFNLMDFRDSSAGIITVKSKFGKVIKALELPGLWNGSMSNWNSIFVEVPISTFNPVKTVNDLLRKEHQ